MFEAFVRLRKIQEQAMSTKHTARKPRQRLITWANMKVIRRIGFAMRLDVSWFDSCSRWLQTTCVDVIKVNIRTSSCTWFVSGTANEEGVFHAVLISVLTKNQSEAQQTTEAQANYESQRRKRERSISIVHRCSALLLHGYVSVCLILPWEREENYRKIVLGWI